MRRLCLSLVLLPLGCYNPEPPKGEALETESGSTSDGQTSGDPTGPETETTEPTVGETDPSGGSSSEGGDPVCGDGEVEGDEVCDDGVNDGGYAGCNEDCTALGPHCGDGEVTDDEVCDDGVNDGSYGTCNDDCTLAAFCGDGSLDAGDELCDEGESNENGSGCNIDCTTSGTILHEIVQGGMTFCDGAFTTPARFNSEGNAMVSASGYCTDDTQALVELSPTLELVTMFDVLLAGTPMREAAMLGDKWVLSASDCNYAIVDGAFSEVCATDRSTGYVALETLGAPGYVALDYDHVAVFGPMSPMAGDMPVWEATKPPDGTFQYEWDDAARGPNDSVLIVGQRFQPTNGTSLGMLLQYTAAGNLVDTNTYASSPRFNEIATSPAGGAFLYSGYPTYSITLLNAAFGEVWTLPLTNPGNPDIAMDSTGAPIILMEDGNNNGAYELRKLDPADGSVVWSVGLPNASYYSRISVAPDDYIWVTSAGYGGMGGQLAVTRVTP